MLDEKAHDGLLTSEETIPIKTTFDAGMSIVYGFCVIHSHFVSIESLIYCYDLKNLNYEF